MLRQYIPARGFSPRKIGILIMAYSPIEHGSTGQRSMLEHPQLKKIARRHQVTPAQVALAWLLQQDVVTIPKASNPKHVRENRGALDLKLAETDLMELDLAFPPPRTKMPLEVR